ncbi:MAG: hypothetical protein KJ955_06385 [Nanoarchaeota archaeon]|nr:hypothetical protein [Nanoarchaeota archaeon]
MIRQVLATAGLALLAAAGCKGISPDDYRIKAGHCKQDYECGMVCFSGMTAFNADKGPEYIVTNTQDDSKKGYPFYAGTAEIVMDECVFEVMRINDDSVEYKARERKGEPQSKFIFIPMEVF